MNDDLKSRPTNRAMASDVQEDSLDGDLRKRRLTHWMDRLFDEQHKEGKFDNLPNAGKPLKIDLNAPPESIFNGILKEANVLPPWLELQHEIRDMIKRLSLDMERLAEEQREQAIVAINTKIRKYNTMVPSPIMQKGLVTASNIRTIVHKWT